jgi:NitT/TauT family transport system permease protein
MPRYLNALSLKVKRWQCMKKKGFFVDIIGFILVLLFWQALSFVYPKSIVVGVDESIKTLIKLSHKPFFWNDILVTLSRVVIASLVSLGIGLLLSLEKHLREIFYPIAVFLEAIPPIGWIVLAILWFSIGNWPPIVVGISFALPAVFFNLYEGLRAVPKELIEMAKAFNLSRMRTLFYIYIPALSPAIFSAFTVSFSMNWRAVVMAEAFGSYTGLGQRFWGFYIFGSTMEIYAYLLLISVLGLTIEYLVLRPFKALLVARLRLGEVG